MEESSKVFISHSSKDLAFIQSTIDFFKNLGVNNERIFCSSIEGNGVIQGSRIEDAIKKELKNSSTLIYVISKNFMESQACMQELGVGWYNIGEKKSFFILLDDVKMDDIKGFLSNSYKFTFVNTESLGEFVDDLTDSMSLVKPKYAIIAKSIKTYIENTKEHILKNVENAGLTEEEKQKKELERLHQSISKLNTAEKRVIAYLYFKEDRIGSFDISSGIINLLSRKNIVSVLSRLSTSGYNFPYTLNPWIIDYIDENSDFKSELKKLKKNADSY